LTFLGTAIAIASLSSGEETGSAPKATTSVEVTQVLRRGGSRIVKFSGVTRPSDRARLSFVVNGRLAELLVEVGDRVRAGQLLAALDTAEFELSERAATSALTELEVRLAQARRSEQRVNLLHEKQAATDEEVEQVAMATDSLEAALISATVKLDQARRLIRESSLVAPFAGTVIDLEVEQGEWAGAGKPILEIVGSKDFEVEIEVPESIVVNVIEDRPVRVEFPLIGLRVSGNLTSSAKAAAGMGRLFPVVISLEDHSDIIAGATAEVELEIRQRESLVIPLEAILNPGSSRPSVFRIVDGQAERVFVEVDRIDGRDVRVKGGLDDGDEIVISGHTVLADGDRVEVQ